MDAIGSVLAQLPEPVPPATLTSTVMARIAREAERSAPAAPEPHRRIRQTDRPAWILSAVGAALVAALSIHGLLSAGAVPDLTSSRLGIGRATVMPVFGAGWLFLGCAIWLFLAGLFAPLRRGRP